MHFIVDFVTRDGEQTTRKMGDADNPVKKKKNSSRREKKEKEKN